jgi:hypothetical protein
MTSMHVSRGLAPIVRAPLIAVGWLVVGVAVVVWIVLVPLVELVRAGVQRLGGTPQPGAANAEVPHPSEFWVVPGPERPPASASAPKARRRASAEP